LGDDLIPAVPQSAGEAARKVLSFENDKARMLHSGTVRLAGSSLLAVGVLSAIGQLIDFVMGCSKEALVGGLIFAAFYVGLWHWSKRRPLKATAIGLGVYVALAVGNLIIDPAILLRGLVFRILVVALLIRGVRAGLLLRHHGITAL